MNYLKVNTRRIALCFFVLFAIMLSEAQVNFGSAAAFSLRRIIPTYTGSAIQVRRSNDNATQNIGFTACGFLDTASLKAFVGANSASVSIWYDQSGNARDASQSTAASQPRIVNSGTVDYVNKRPTIVWPGTSSNGIFLAYSGTVTARSVNAVRDFKFNPFTASGNNMQYLFSCPANTDYSVRLSSTGNFSYDGDNNVNDWITGSGAPKLCWVNGTQTTTAQYALHTITAAGSATVNGSFSIGSTFLSRDLFNNDAVSELVVYSNTITNTQRTLIETCESVIYSVTISNSKYTPPTSSTYMYYINGIGREGAADSINTTRSSKGMGFKTGSTATDFLKDNGDYLTVGMNCPVTPTTSSANLPVGVVQRWGNDWYVNKTDVSSNNGNVTIYFDYTDYGVGGAPGAASSYVLLTRANTAANFATVAVTSTSVSGSRVLFTLDASGISNGYYTIGTANNVTSPLPVELSRFQCSVEDEAHAYLSWTTLSEQNNSGFLVERSTDGFNYQAIAKVNGSGTSKQMKNYEYTDVKPLSGNLYYRLKQMNTDGTFKIYNPCFMNIEQAAEFSIFPNPAGGYVDITLSSKDLTATVSLLHISQKLVMQQQFSNRVRLSTDDLEDGLYLVTVNDGYSVITKKLVIRH